MHWLFQNIFDMCQCLVVIMSKKIFFLNSSSIYNVFHRKWRPPPPKIVKQWPLVNEFHIIWYRTVRVVLDNFEHLPLFCVKKAIHNTHVRIQKKFQRGGGATLVCTFSAQKSGGWVGWRTNDTKWPFFVKDFQLKGVATPIPLQIHHWHTYQKCHECKI